ncbi:RING-type zinc-finger protein [Fragilaria crotonensis]|nr:RING-type zinc-finger protein [Fragilaria crotonensis]
MLCLVGTSWCARFIRYNREREEELDRRINAYMENNEDGEGRPDFRMLSFQAQLALAIMESQRQMMQGGFGHPDGHERSGVSDEVRNMWSDSTIRRSKMYPLLRTRRASTEASVNTTAANHRCTICLGDYEDGEELVKPLWSHVSQ